jgi:ribosomal-protein-alanine N-acetyltransferase
VSKSQFWLTTERLALRRFAAADLDWLATLYSDAEVMRYGGGPKDRTKVAELLNVRILQYYDLHPTLGIWLTIDRSTGTALGFHLLNHIRGESLVQVGFFLSAQA